MQITDIKAYPVWVGRRNQLFVKVETANGLFGWGESGLSSREQAVCGAIEHFKRFLYGKDPRQRGALWQEMYRSQYFEGGRVLTSAMSAIDIALYDLVGKYYDVPVYQLLGGRHRKRVPTFATVPGKDYEEIRAGVKKLIEAGWSCIRIGGQGAGNNETEDGIYEPRRAMARMADWLPEIRREFGNGPVLGLEFHHRLSVAEAANFCQKLPSGTLDFIEEPIRDESVDAYRELRRLTPIPFALGEEFASKWTFAPYIEAGLSDYVRVDISNIGGFTEAAKVAAMAEVKYRDLMPHNPLGAITTAATVHLGAAVPNFSWMEIRISPTEQMQYPDENLFPIQLKLDGPDFPVPDAPGLGIECNEDAFKELEFEYHEPPHLHREDGSYTNW